MKTTILDSLGESKDDIVRARQRNATAHRLLLRLLYHIPVDLTLCSSGPLELYVKDLVDVADMYGCRDVIAQYIQRHLLYFKTNDVFLAECVNEPTQMLDFAVLLKCDWVFREVIIHLLSRPERYEVHKDAISEHGLEELCQRKMKELQIRILEVANDIMSSTAIASSTTTKACEIGKYYYQQRIALCMRAWLKDRPSFVFRALGRGIIPMATSSLETSVGDFSYRFHEGERGTQTGYDSCLALASAKAQELLQNPCSVSTKHQYQAGTHDAPLICINITDEELPWNRKSLELRIAKDHDL